MSFAMSNMVTQTIMARYHACKAHILAAEAANVTAAPAATAQPSAPAPAPSLVIPFDAATLVCALFIPLCSATTFSRTGRTHTHTHTQDPVPSVETLRAALLARAAHDPVLTDIPLTDVYRAGALAKHA